MFLTVVRGKGDSACIAVTLHDTDKHAACTIFVHKLALSRTRKVLLSCDLKNRRQPTQGSLESHFLKADTGLHLSSFSRNITSPHNAETTRHSPLEVLSSREKFGRTLLEEL
jgi:hypothetical protein